MRRIWTLEVAALILIVSLVGLAMFNKSRAETGNQSPPDLGRTNEVEGSIRPINLGWTADRYHTVQLIHNGGEIHQIKLVMETLVEEGYTIENMVVTSFVAKARRDHETGTILSDQVPNTVTFIVSKK